MERYAIIIRPNEETVLLHCYPGDSLDLKTLQEIVEGHIETVPTALAGEYPQAADFLKLMKSIERKVESDAE